MKKKLLSVVLTIILLLSTIPVSLTTTAATINETESNNSYSSANSFSLNSTISGKLSDSNDKDYFKLTPSQNGKIALTFSHDYADDWGVYWVIEMYAYSSGKYTEFYKETIYANSGEINQLPSIGAASGTVYYIKISTYSSETAGLIYNLKNEFTATNYYEKEINNSYNIATPMSFNQTYGGVLNDSDDVDVYKFSPSQNGKISLSFLHDYSDDWGVYWVIEMYAYSSGKYTEFYNQTIYARSDEINILPPIGASSDTTYFLKIYTHSSETIGFEYSIKNEFTATNYYEKEVNNDSSSATPISLGSKYGGVINDEDDFDFYKVTVSSTSTPLSFFHDYVDDYWVSWEIKVMDSNYSEKFSTRVRGADSNGVITTLNQTGTYYIQIRTYNKETMDYEYSLLVGNSTYTVSGTETSYLSDTDTVTIDLMSGSKRVAGTTVKGNSKSYSIPNVVAGSYTLRVSKKNHVTRDYAITVSGNKTQNVKICPLGDVDGNGKVQANDAMLAYQHAQGKANAQLSGYAFLCAEVAPVGNPNGKVQAADAMVIYQQAQGKHSLF